MDTNQLQVIPLWPDGAPGSESWDQLEEEITLPNGLPAVRNISQPSLTVYPAQNPNGAAVIVAPGGAHHFLAIAHEGTEVAAWLNARGITAFVYKYRVMQTGADMQQQMREFFTNRAAHEAELQQLYALIHEDTAQAIRIVRQRAAEWSVDPQRVGIMGFSAGGHVTAQRALDYTPETRPDFAAPIYAAVFDEVTARPDAPPLFLLCAQDDEMASRASLLMYSAWKAVKRPVEMHIYASGGHGFGMRPLGQPVDTWIERFGDWLGGMGMLGK